MLRQSIFAGLLVLASAASAQEIAVTPSAIQATDLAPGVQLSYWYAPFEHVDKFVELTKSKQGWTPQAVNALDQCDANGKLYAAGVIEHYAIKGQGFISFPRAGDWKVAVKANDGIRLMLDGKVVAEDPGVHGNRMTKPATVKVSAPGMVPFEFYYFQKKGSACLELHWEAPGETQMIIVPGSALSHKKS